jgi:hypothetical protein
MGLCDGLYARGAVADAVRSDHTSSVVPLAERFPETHRGAYKRNPVAARQAEGAGAGRDPDLGSDPELVDRALEVHGT